ncbi:MAG: hypothetical protein ACJARS_003885 [bacterium]|jgi:hypothetical protein
MLRVGGVGTRLLVGESSRHGMARGLFRLIRASRPERSHRVTPPATPLWVQ